MICNRRRDVWLKLHLLPGRSMLCNDNVPNGTRSNILFGRDVGCNVCGAWLQGTFAFLDDKARRDPLALLRTLTKRDPPLAFLWLGAFITGASTRCLEEARMGWWKVDLSAAAWTGTHMSFIQEVIPKASPNTREISRANECRMIYLAHGPDHAAPPLFPFPPFGSTAIDDTDLDVRRHVGCWAAHALEYSSFSWDCRGGKKVEQERVGAHSTIRAKTGQPPRWNSALRTQ